MASSKQLEVYLRERCPKNVQEMTELAEKYLEAHGGFDSTSGKSTKIDRVQVSGSQGLVSINDRKFYDCGQKGHIARDCTFNQTSPKQTKPRVTSAALEGQDQSRSDRNYEKGGYGRQPHGRKGKYPGKRNEASACVNERQIQIPDSDEVSQTTDPKIPLMTTACKDHDESNMPVTKGKVGNTIVSVLRDTGCSSAVIKSDLVSDGQLTGNKETCRLIDGTLKQFPEAVVCVDTPYYKGNVRVLCMKNPVYDLILGNFTGVRAPDDPDGTWGEEECVDRKECKQTADISETTGKVVQGQAVETRMQKMKNKQAVKGIKVTSPIDNVTVENLIGEQKTDETLRTAWELSSKGDTKISKNGDEVKYVVRKKILYREYCSPRADNKKMFRQVCIPSKYRNQVMKIAHEGILSGHMGIKRTREKILSQFYWPGISGDVERYCKSCDICQKTFPKGKVSKVPLGEMPLIKTPFDRVAVDLVGPIAPVTEKGNRYILTLVDYATRYPEVVPLKGTETERVAEALVSMFSRVGVPREILTDLGTQFTSGLMKEVSRLLSMKQLTTTPYHPQCNGLVEKFNGTLKTMLKKTVQRDQRTGTVTLTLCYLLIERQDRKVWDFHPLNFFMAER